MYRGCAAGKSRGMGDACARPSYSGLPSLKENLECLQPPSIMSIPVRNYPLCFASCGMIAPLYASLPLISHPSNGTHSLRVAFNRPRMLVIIFASLCGQNSEEMGLQQSKYHLTNTS